MRPQHVPKLGDETKVRDLRDLADGRQSEGFDGLEDWETFLRIDRGSEHVGIDELDHVPTLTVVTRPHSSIGQCDRTEVELRHYHSASDIERLRQSTRVEGTYFLLELAPLLPDLIDLLANLVAEPHESAKPVERGGGEDDDRTEPDDQADNNDGYRSDSQKTVRLNPLNHVVSL